MLLKKFHNLAFSLLFALIFLISGSKLQADAIITQGGGYAQGGAYINANAGYGQPGMWGTGYYGGVQGCNQNWSQGSGAVDMSDEEKEERKAISESKMALEKAKLEQKRAQAEMDFAKRKLERVFDSEILDFLVDVHMDNTNLCSAYRVAPPAATAGVGATSCLSVDANDQLVAGDEAKCGGLVEIPEKLQKNWIKPGNLGYCTANSQSTKGSISSKICSDATLRPEDAPKYRSYSTTECGKALGDYKKHKIKSDKAQGIIEQMEDEIRERQYAISDAKERAKLEAKYRQATTSETDCPECDAAARGYTYSKPKRDWAAILGQVGVGLGLGFLGKKYDDRNAEYSAQLGYPPQQGYPTAVSMGLPFILGGVYGAINGTSGQGGFGCAGGMNGTGGVYGAGNGMNGPFGGAGGVYGPYANMGGGGAFGYPQGMFGTPWGGGMYNPGYGAGGMIAGPWGGYPGGMGNGGFAMSAMINGGFMANGGYMMGGSMMGGMPMSGAMGNMMGGSQMIQCFMPPCPGAMVSGGLAMNGGFLMNGGMPMSGMQMPGFQMGGFNMGGFQMPGYMMSGGLAMNGGMQMPGFQMGGFQMPGGLAMNGGQMGGFQMPGFQMGGQIPGMQMQAMINGGIGYMQPGYMQTGAMVADQYQQQMMQQQMQMQQQMMQQQMQYQQAQMQAQMQAYQRQMAVQQQAAQVQQEIQSLQIRLQMLYSGAYTSNSTFNTGGIPYPTGTYPAGTGSVIPTIGTVTPTGTQITVPTNGR
jgi:uncharacterized protein